MIYRCSRFHAHRAYRLAGILQNVALQQTIPTTRTLSLSAVNVNDKHNVTSINTTAPLMHVGHRCFASEHNIKNMPHHKTASQENVMNVFDRKTKRTQKNRTALMKDYEVYDYLKEEVGYRVADRILDVKRKFDVAVDLGCGRGYVSQNIYSDMVGTLFQCEMAEKVLEQSAISPEVPTFKVHADEEFFPFRNSSLDLVVSSLSLHWVNDLPGSLKQINMALKNDGCILGAVFGGETLYQLRIALQLAEQEKEGGFAPHISPFTSVQDLGNLLNRAGFRMLTIDVDEITVNYPSIYELMHDLQGMGENNASWNRKPMLHRETTKTAATIYKDRFGKEDGTIPASFHIINFIGWKPDPSQPAPAKRGSGTVSIKDIGELDKITEPVENLKTNDTSGIDQITKTIEDLRKQTMLDTSNDKDEYKKDK